MRADHAVRHNAAVGALVGLAVGDALAQSTELPPVICGGTTASPTWSSVAERSFVQAERLLNRELLDIDLGPTDIIAAAIALADPDAPPPLLADPDTVLMCDIVRAGLLGTFKTTHASGSSNDVGTAIDVVASSSSFCGALEVCGLTDRPLVAALGGLRWGPGAIPATWATALSGPVGDRTYGLRQLRRLAERLMQQDAPVPPEPRRSLGPREVAPNLWLSNLHAVPRFLAEHPDGAVLSLCPTTGTFDNHTIRREFAIHDAGGSTVNPHLAATLDEVLSTIAAFHAEDRPVLVHCHHGASRTGLVLRAWLIDELGLDAEDATTEAQVRWSKTSTWNAAFNAEIKRRAASR